jgi:type IV pilus assembly protein PilE
MRRIRGFTLVELIVVVAIIAILAAVAIPSYQRYTQRSNRAAAQAFMADVVNKEQLYLQTARQFGTLTDLGITIPSQVAKFYAVTVATVPGPPPGFTVTATPSGTQASDGWLAIDQDSTKTSQYPNKW